MNLDFCNEFFLEKHSMEILWIICINKDSPSSWGGQTLANTYNTLSIKRHFCVSYILGVLQIFQKPKGGNLLGPWYDLNSSKKSAPIKSQIY